jgi:DNA polymerase-3 subunit epsilon
MDEYTWWGTTNPPPSRYVTAKLLRQKFLRPLQPAGFIRGTHGRILLYDLDNPESAGTYLPQNAEEWTAWNEYEKANEHSRWSNRLDGRFATDKYEALLEVQRICAEPFVILDTETTGLDDHAEPVEIAVIDHNLQTLMNTRIKPGIPIPRKASEIHGIHDIDIKYAPPFSAVARELSEILSSARVLIYNYQYDTRILWYAYRLAGLELPEINPSEKHKRSCLMDLYSVYVGDWRGRSRGYRWQALNGGHSALSDCRAAFALLMEMKTKEVVTPDEAFEEFWAEFMSREFDRELATTEGLEYRQESLSAFDCLRWSH